MHESTRPATWKLLLAFSMIYFVWGSTFLAIRIGVHEVPPLLFAAMRFLTAGVLLYGVLRLQGTRSPSFREWGGASILAAMIFLVDYGLLFWAETRVPSGITAVMMATIPAFTAISEIVILRTQQLTARLLIALLLGIGGVAVLVSRSVSFGEVPIDVTGACALIIASVSWSIAAALNRKLPLPADKAMSAAAQMVGGGALLTIAAAGFGDFHGFHIESVSRTAWFSLAYLIVAGSIIAFTAYVWLLHHESPTKVGTYAYVNPVVAVLVGYFLGGEALGSRTIVGTSLVLVSVLVITISPAKKRAPEFLQPQPQELEP